MTRNLEEYIDVNISMDNTVLIDGERWFYDYRLNAVCKLDFNKAEVRVVRELPLFGLDNVRIKLYGKIIENNGKIYILPEANVPIAVYDIQNDTITYLRIDVDKNRVAGKVFSSFIIQEGESIYLVPYAYDRIVKININSNTISYIQIGDTEDGSSEYGRISWDCITRDASQVYFSNLKLNSVMRLDLSTDAVKIVISDISYEPASVCGGQDSLYVVDMESRYIGRYNSKTYDLEKMIPIKIDGYNPGSNSRIIDCDDRIFLLGRNANMCISFDKNTEIFKSLDTHVNQYETLYAKSFYYSNVSRYNNKYYLFSNVEKLVKVYNENMECMEKTIFKIRKNDLLKLMRARMKRLMSENGLMELNLFLEAMVNSYD